MGVTICQIHLDTPKEGFKGGDIVSGEVNYVLSKSIDFKAITLSLEGTGQCSWSIHINKVTITYYGRENIFTLNSQLLNTSSKERKAILAEGSHTIRFQFLLPSNLPPTFRENVYNFISYRVKVIFTRAEVLKRNRTFKVEIPVRAHVDIGTDDYAVERNAISFVITKPVWKLFTRDGDVIAKINLPRTAYLPGEQIQLAYEVNNQSTLILPGIKTKIIQAIKYTANCGSEHVIRRVLCKATPTRGIDCGLQKSIPCEVRIPEGTDPVVQHSRVISTMYFLRITVRLPGMRKNSKFETPIIIGSCFRPSPMQPPPDYLNPVAGSSSSEQQLPPLPPAYKEFPSDAQEPPSYWEAMQECLDDDM